MTTQMVVLGGRLFEDAASLRKRLHIEEVALRRSVADGRLPPPVMIGRKRYFERGQVDEFLLRQVDVR